LYRDFPYTRINDIPSRLVLQSLVREKDAAHEGEVGIKWHGNTSNSAAME
jgi:hypothetical protein